MWNSLLALVAIILSFQCATDAPETLREIDLNGVRTKFFDPRKLTRTLTPVSAEESLEEDRKLCPWLFEEGGDVKFRALIEKELSPKLADLLTFIPCKEFAIIPEHFPKCAIDRSKIPFYAYLGEDRMTNMNMVAHAIDPSSIFVFDEKGGLRATIKLDAENPCFYNGSGLFDISEPDQQRFDKLFLHATEFPSNKKVFDCLEIMYKNEFRKGITKGNLETFILRITRVDQKFGLGEVLEAKSNQLRIECGDSIPGFRECFKKGHICGYLCEFRFDEEADFPVVSIAGNFNKGVAGIVFTLPQAYSDQMSSSPLKASEKANDPDQWVLESVR